MDSYATIHDGALMKSGFPIIKYPRKICENIFLGVLPPKWLYVDLFLFASIL